MSEIQQKLWFDGSWWVRTCGAKPVEPVDPVEPVTTIEAMPARGNRGGRPRRLTDNDVYLIRARRMSGEPFAAIAADYPATSEKTIRRACRGVGAYDAT